MDKLIAEKIAGIEPFVQNAAICLVDVAICVKIGGFRNIRMHAFIQFRLKER